MSQNKRLLLCWASLITGHCLGAVFWYGWHDAVDAIFYQTMALLVYGVLWREPA